MKFKRFLSVLVAFVFILSMLPASVSAMLGPVTFPERSEVTYRYGDTSKTYAGHENSSPKGTYYMLFNDYITFILRPNGMMSTVPTRTLDSLFKQYMYTNIWPDFAYRVPVTEIPSFYADTGASIDLKNKATGTPAISQAGVNKLQAVYTITSTDKPVTFKVTYEIVRVDAGKTDGDYGEGLIAPDPNDSGRAWGVKVSGTVEYAGTKLYSTNQSTGDEADDYGAASFTMLTEHIDFAKNRNSGEQGALQYSKYGNGGVGQFSGFWNSSVQMPRTSTGAADGEISEFFTSSFGADNQFVATSLGYQGSWQGGETQLSGTLGHASRYGVGANYGEMITYKPDESYTKINGDNTSKRKTLKVYSTAVMNKDTDTDGVSDFTVDALWGYRDLYTDNDNDTPSDITYYREVKNGGHLGIVKESDGAVAAVEGQSIDALKAAYGNKLLAVYRGDWEREGTDYRFKGNVALSPSVTATARSAYSSFTVSEDGAVTMSNIGLSCPSFQFFTGDESGITFDYANSSAGELKIVIDPNKNDSVLHLDIPGATSIMEGAKIGIDGSLVFSGTMGIYTPVLEIVNLQLDRVGMDYDSKGNYKVNGIEASGRVGMPDIIGFPVPDNHAEAEINTFNGEERYHFEVAIAIPNLFESEASLTLSRLDNGALVPDDLELMVDAGFGVPLVPPVVVAEITGIGGGFSDLADSIDGDFFAVPPAKISLAANAEVLQMLSGRATMTMGLGYYETKLSDPVFFDLIGFDAEYKENVYFSVEERKWDEKVSEADLARYEMFSLPYTGIAVGGSRTLEIHLPSESLNILNISSGLKLDVFAGTAKGTGGSPLYVHFNAQGSGGMKASLVFPKKIGSLKVPKIGGRTLASTEVWLSLGYKSVFAFHGDDLLGTIWDSMKNASLSATITYKKNILDLATVWFNVVFADKKQFGLGINTFIGNLNTTINLGSKGRARLMSVGETEDSYYAIYANTGIESLASTDGINLLSIEMDDDMAAKLAAAGITLAQTEGKEAAENSYDITLADNAKPGQIMLMLTPKSGEYTDDELEEMFTVTDANGDKHEFNFNEYDEETGDSTVPNANAYISASGEDVDYETGAAIDIPASVVMMLPSTGDWTISADEAFDIEVFGFELSEDINDSGVIENLKEDKEYVLQGFLVDENGKYYQVGSYSEGAVSSGDAENSDYVSDFVVANDASVRSFEFTNQYDSAPSGTYKKVYRLLEKLETDTEPKSVYYRTLDEYEDGEIAITNPNEIPAPTNVTAQAMGSEILSASWEAPTMPAGKNIDGYMVTIYEKSGEEWVTTGTGYEVRKNEDGNIPTTVDMALTIGGSGEVDGETDENAKLEANKYYRISVATLSDTTADLDGDGEEDTVSKRSTEAYSDEAGVYIKKATPPTLTYLPEPEVLEGANMKTLYVSAGDEILITSSETADISAARMDNSVTLASGTGTELAVEVPDFEGNLIIQIDAVDTEGDRVRDYISLKKDTVAPVITVDNEIFKADGNGNFTITGITEAGAEIVVDNGNEYIETIGVNTEDGYVEKADYTVTREDDGSFTIKGKLSEITKGDSLNPGGALIYMTATDKAGNESDWTYANVIYEANSQTPAAPGGGGGGTVNCTVKFETNGGTVIANKAVARNATLAEPEAPTKTGYTFAGWYTDEALTTAYDFTARVTKDIVLYAKWVAEDGGSDLPQAWKNPFADVRLADWFYDDVRYVNENGLMNGTSETSFLPNGKLTRAMLVTILYRAEGEPDVGDGVSQFEDVAGNAYYAKAVAWGQQNGIIKGYSETEFAPDKYIIREQIAAIMHRYAQYKEYDVSVGESTDLLSYDDYADISEYAIAPMQYAVGSGLIQGKTASTLNPLDNATRAETAAIIHRFTKK